MGRQSSESRADTPLAVVGGRLLSGLVDLTDDLGALDGTGLWAVMVPFEGPAVCARFAHARPSPQWSGPPWPGLPHGIEGWRTSLDEAAFMGGVDAIRARIASGSVYQVNLTRRCTTALPHDADIAALGAALATGNPAPFSAVLRLPSIGVHVASASPERFLERDGSRLWSSPIKGTATSEAELLAKDHAENVMIVDLVRNDLGRVCTWGSVTVPALCALEAHPGLVHLVSTVEGTLRDDVGWPDILDATFPPGSVTGAPKIAALEAIGELEPVPRGPYCGALGWVDADRRTASLNVAIRTFWFEDDTLCFATGGGITWDSDPSGEWRETELKARNLLTVAGARGGRINS